ncbi:hypothetical protein CK203_021745 [Vitis vinifera]|uniref:Uncharacterized protein n=1 Tax=Vitis vinifera TaxID=29760 RepID=A0A438J4Y4_VITVI|nr:hypothetical protein CK203_021745 [Vitis vinifera]
MQMTAVRELQLWQEDWEEPEKMPIGIIQRVRLWWEGQRKRWKRNESNVGSPVMVGESEKAMEDAIRSSEKNAATMSGLEKAIEDANKIKEKRVMSGIGTIEIPGLDLEARICKLERVVAGLKLQDFVRA